MTKETQLTLQTFQDGRAVIHVDYGGKQARIEIDQVEQAAGDDGLEQRTRAELSSLNEALGEWLASSRSIRDKH